MPSFIRRSYRARLMALLIPLMMLPVLAVGISSYVLAYSVIQDNTRSSSLRSLEQLSKALDSTIARVRAHTLNIMINSELQELLVMEVAGVSVREGLENQEAFQQLAARMFFEDPLVHSLVVLKREVGMFRFREAELGDERVYRNSKWFDRAQAPRAGVTWIEPTVLETAFARNKPAYLVGGPIRNMEEVDERIGYFVLTIDMDRMAEVMDLDGSAHPREMSLVDPQGRIAIHPDPSLIGVAASTVYSELGAARTAGGSFVEEAGADAFLVTYHRSAESGWTLVERISLNELMRPATRLGTNAVLVSLGCLVLLVIISGWISRSTTRPIMRLKEGMARVEAGDLHERLDVHSEDEIGQIAHAFNTMVHEVNVLVNEVVEKEKLVKQAEIAALQAQINPHFLYNTLNTIKLMAMARGADEIKQVVIALVRLLEGTVYKHGRAIPIRQEIENVRNYVYIQRVRYEECVSFEFDVADEICELYTLNMTLQPLVENAIYHGVDHSSGDARIVVSGAIEHDAVVLTVADNGNGIENEYPGDRPSDHTDVDRLSGMGVRNVDERIKLNFGSDYGVTVTRRPEGGTVARITIPVIRENPDV